MTPEIRNTLPLKFQHGSIMFTLAQDTDGGLTLAANDNPPMPMTTWTVPVRMAALKAQADSWSK